MRKTKRFFYPLVLIPLLLILTLLGWFFAIVFEGDKPVAALQPLPAFLSGDQPFVLEADDRKRGLRSIRVTVTQEGREVKVFEEQFPFQGFLNRQGTHDYKKEFKIDPSVLNLAQGRVDLHIHVRDYSRRSGGDGNLNLIHHKMTVDTIPPSVSALSRMHNINRGGSGLVLYQTSSDTRISGVFVDDNFFPGSPAGKDPLKGYHVCYFALPHDSSSDPNIFLWAEDEARNVSRTTFYYHIIPKRFRKDKMNITDGFLERVIPYFSFYPMESEKTLIEKYLKINNALRKENDRTLQELVKKTAAVQLWEGPFLRQQNAATMARFADHRQYYYKGEKVDEQTHLGVDLASLANSSVPASNNGRVLFAGRVGIYGSTVLLDHGQGVVTVYSHLSRIDVAVDQEVKKGDIIGLTGQTGLAGGDHLHFAVMVHGLFVNPVEWWDSHWIKDNISIKLAQIQE
ncbi:MAG: M23 family metallopeptidase [Desulfatiglandales bacterium]